MSTFRFRASALRELADFHLLDDACSMALEKIARWFDEHGDQPYEGARREAVTALEHALQCAQLAEWAGAQDPLVVAALLHDVGHFGATEDEQTDDAHEERAVAMLAGHFDAAVLEPIRLHVAAKRYLVATNAAYAATLSPASVHSLELQGGPMTPEEAAAFRALAHADQAVQLRRWDDAAKEPGRATPTLDRYLDLMAGLLRG